MTTYKTLDEVPREILEKTTLIQISRLVDEGWVSSIESHRTISFIRKPEDNYRQWYKETELFTENHDIIENSTPVTEAEMMKILKQKYNYYNRKYKYFAIEFSDYRHLRTLCYVSPRPHPEVCDSGISVFNLNDDDAFEKMEKAVGGFNGHRTSAPSRRAAPKKRTPAVKVNVRKMF